MKTIIRPTVLGLGVLALVLATATPAEAQRRGGRTGVYISTPVGTFSTSGQYYPYGPYRYYGGYYYPRYYDRYYYDRPYVSYYYRPGYVDRYHYYWSGGYHICLDRSTGNYWYRDGGWWYRWY